MNGGISIDSIDLGKLFRESWIWKLHSRSSMYTQVEYFNAYADETDATQVHSDEVSAPPSTANCPALLQPDIAYKVYAGPQYPPIPWPITCGNG